MLESAPVVTDGSHAGEGRRQVLTGRQVVGIGAVGGELVCNEVGAHWCLAIGARELPDRLQLAQLATGRRVAPRSARRAGAIVRSDDSDVQIGVRPVLRQL